MADDRSALFARRFSAALEDACQRLGKLKKELAYSCSMRPDYFSKLQSGARRPRDRETVELIARGLHLDHRGTNRLMEAAGFHQEPEESSPPKGIGAARKRSRLGMAVPLGHLPERTQLLIRAGEMLLERIHIGLARLGVTYPEAVTIVCLARARSGQLSMPDLSEAIGWTDGATALIVSQLEERGLVQRMRGAGAEEREAVREGLFTSGPATWDARYVVVALTPAGSTLDEPIRWFLESIEAAIHRSLNAATTDTLRAMITGDAFATAGSGDQPAGGRKSRLAPRSLSLSSPHDPRSARWTSRRTDRAG